MSIVVDLAELRSAAARFPVAYLLTAGEGSRVKSVGAHVEVGGPDGDVWRVPAAGRGSVANARTAGVATLLYPPHEEHGYTLIVDADAAVDGEDVVLTPTHAVLHRPADHARASGVEPSSACGHDCAPVGGADPATGSPVPAS